MSHDKPISLIVLSYQSAIHRQPTPTKGGMETGRWKDSFLRSISCKLSSASFHLYFWPLQRLPTVKPSESRISASRPPRSPAATNSSEQSTSIRPFRATNTRSSRQDISSRGRARVALAAPFVPTSSRPVSCRYFYKYQELAACIACCRPSFRA